MDLPPLKLWCLDIRVLPDSMAEGIRIRDRPALFSRGVLSSETLLCVRVKSALRKVGEGGPEELADSGKAGVTLKSSAAERPEWPDQVF